eukprot:symbB.v1.2.001381.t1/scaffold67.1/size356791/7
MCEVLFLVVLLAVCLFCFWDVLKDVMVEREELAEEAMKDMEQMIIKIQPSLKQTAEKFTASASLTIEAGRTLVSSPQQVTEEVDSSDDEENDRKAMAAMQWMRSWSPRRSARASTT